MWYNSQYIDRLNYGGSIMKDGKIPNPDTIHPIAGYDKEIYVKPTIFDIKRFRKSENRN